MDPTLGLPILLPHLPLRLLSSIDGRRCLHRRLSLHLEARVLFLDHVRDS